MSINFLIGRKVGMTRIFDDLGSDYPVTVLCGGPCYITQIKSLDNGASIQLGFENKADRHVNNPEKGHFKKAGVSPKKILKEFLTNFQKISKINKENLEKIINELINKHKTNFKGVGQPLRVALTGSKFGPGVYDIIISLEKDEVIKRLKVIN